MAASRRFAALCQRSYAAALRVPAARQLARIGFGTSKARVTPAKLLARALDLVLAERRAVGRGGALLVRRAIADDGAAGDQRRPVGRGARIRDGERDRFGLVTVDFRRVPARGAEALDLVVGHREPGRTVDGNLIVVEQHDQPPELEVAGKRDRLLADALHEAAVAGDHVGVVIDDVIAIALR